MGALARYAELFGDVGHGPAMVEDALDQERPSPNRQACITVSHEISCAGEDFDSST